MLQLNADRFLMLGQALNLMKTPPGDPDQPVSPHWENVLMGATEKLRETTLALGLQVAAGIVTRRQEEYRSSLPSRRKMGSDFANLTECIEEELRNRWFLYLEPARVAYYEHGPDPFGEDVSKNFPSAAYDIREACKCFALERHTATVFHLTRVLEKGIGALAGEVGITLDPAYENWQNVLDQIDKKTRAKYEAMPKGPAKAEAQERYGKATAEFRHFQVAWRNHVAHGRGVYEAEEAETVMRHVRSFMRHLATWLKEIQ